MFKYVFTTTVQNYMETFQRKVVIGNFNLTKCEIVTSVVYFSVRLQIRFIKMFRGVYCIWVRLFFVQIFILSTFLFLTCAD